MNIYLHLSEDTIKTILVIIINISIENFVFIQNLAYLQRIFTFVINSLKTFLFQVSRYWQCFCVFVIKILLYTCRSFFPLLSVPMNAIVENVCFFCQYRTFLTAVFPLKCKYLFNLSNTNLWKIFSLISNVKFGTVCFECPNFFYKVFLLQHFLFKN